MRIADLHQSGNFSMSITLMGKRATTAIEIFAFFAWAAMQTLRVMDT